jgi:omega-amidase
MQDLKITIIQSDLHWEDIGANLAMFEEKIWKIGSTDVIVLPEMFTTGFSMNAKKLGEMMNMRTFKWMKQMADQTGALVLGSFIANVHDRFYNRLLWMEPGGNFKTYDKRHLFRMADEHQVYAPGESLLIGHWKGWRICPLICYDLRFPVWSRNRWNATLKKASYDVLIYVANWPQVRANAWDILLKARAVENLSYVVGVNRVGMDGNGIEHSGNSAIISPKGDPIFTVDAVEAIKTIELNAHSLQAYRDRFPAFLDADDFTIESEEFEERDHLFGLS